jgi:hypothetical protein
MAKIIIQRVGADKPVRVAQTPEVPRRGDVISLHDGDRTVQAVDWRFDNDGVSATVWVR